MNWPYRLICSLCGAASLLGGCARNDATMQEILHGTISYPFVATNPLGVNGKREKLIIRSITGKTEYVIELPNLGEDYNIEVPLAQFDNASSPEGDRPKDLPPAAKTDQEQMEALPNIEDKNPTQVALMDRAFGVAKGDGPKQSPSYTLGIAKINNLYNKRLFEYALIEINNLLAFYPTSIKLLKMKGTLYSKLQNYSLAEKAWTKALELNPRDVVLEKALARLKGHLEPAAN